MRSSYIKLDNLIKGVQFRKVISIIILKDFVVDNFDRKPSMDRLSERELQLILSIWLKNCHQSDCKINDEDIESIINTIRIELNNIHSHYYDYDSYQKSVEEGIKSTLVIYDEILYGATGYLDLEVIDFFEKKYRYDREWIHNYKNVDISILKAFYLDLYRIYTKNLRTVCLSMQSNDIKYISEELFIVHADELIALNSKYKSIIDAFSIDIFDREIKELYSITDFNKITATPLIKLDECRLYIPLLAMLAKAIYEVPFFWMIDNDKQYYNKYGSKHRGTVCEEITSSILLKVFGSDSIYTNIRFWHNKNGEVDILVIYKGMAIIIQNKSKRMTQESISGNIDNVLDDVDKGVIKAYEQANDAKEALNNKECEWRNGNNQIVNLPNINTVIMMCITLDFFPAIDILTKYKIGITEFVPITIFDLSSIVKFNNIADEFCRYLKFRVNAKKCIGGNELYFIGLYEYLKNDRSPCKLVHNGRIFHESANNVEMELNKLLIGKYFPDLL